MNIQQRESAVEKANGCPRCTSWKHQRNDCKMSPNSCGEQLGGSKCTGDHSRLLHGSTNVYCAALNAAFNTFTSNSDLFSCVKEEEDTLYYIQDIPIAKSTKPARVLWDRGSNRVLIREEFAKANRLMSKRVTYNMDTVGEKTKQIKGNIYILDLVDMYNNVRTVWGYGISKIMLSSRPNISKLQHLFPHIPAAAFNELAAKQVDVLIGLNMNELHPAGGLGVDRVGGLSALRSLFGCGWVIGGHHGEIQSPTNCMSHTAATLKIAKLQVLPEPSHTPEFW